jgi:hypothetical protein
VNEIEVAAAFYDQAISELALTSASTTSDTARVMAIRARINARTRKIELHSVAGVLGDARATMDARAITDTILLAFDEHNV